MVLLSFIKGTERHPSLVDGSSFILQGLTERPLSPMNGSSFIYQRNGETPMSPEYFFFIHHGKLRDSNLPWRVLLSFIKGNWVTSSLKNGSSFTHHEKPRDLNLLWMVLLSLIKGNRKTPSPMNGSSFILKGQLTDRIYREWSFFTF